MKRALPGLLLGLIIGCGPTSHDQPTPSTPGSQPTPSDVNVIPAPPAPPPASEPATPAEAPRTPPRPEKTFARNVDQLWTAQGIATLKGATRVEAFRVDSSRAPEANQAQIGGYAIVATGKEQGKEFASKLSAILLKASTYTFETAKKCMFDPGVAFRIWKDKEAVEVVVCFSCDEIEVLVKDEAGKITHVSGEDFDSARPAMVALARQAFPDDKVVQGLTAKRP